MPEDRAPRPEGDWPRYLELPVRRLRAGDSSEDETDPVAVEHHLAVKFQDRGVATLACTPEHLEELVAGFLFGQGLLAPDRHPEEVGWECKLAPDRRVALVRLGAGSGPAAPSVVEATTRPGAGDIEEPQAALPETPQVGWDGRISDWTLSLLAAAFDEAPLFRNTGGAHSALAAAVPSGGNPVVLVTREDIGRRNAVDKVIGSLWLTGGLRTQTGHRREAACVLATSGRVSSDLVMKTARAGFPFLLSHGAPTTMAVELAREFGVTLAGFARGKRLNLYTRPDRVTVGGW